jgi:hypothetical protein
VVSPAFLTFLLLKVSEVLLSEKKYDKRYRGRKDYQQWKENKPMFIPGFKEVSRVGVRNRTYQSLIRE